MSLRHRAAVLGMCMWCVAAVSMLAQRGGQDQPPQPAPKEMSAPDIPDVIRGGTKVTLIRDGFNGTEGVISMPDGSMLFTEQDVDKIIKIDNNGNISTYLEHTNRTIGLAYDHTGRLIGTQSREPRIAVMTPTMAVLAETFEGQPLVRPNDLVIDRKNGIYFTDPIPNPQVAFRPPPAGRKPLLFYITPEGKLTKASEDLQTVNGVQLSPAEKTLYAKSSACRGNCWERSRPACRRKAWVSRDATRRPFSSSAEALCTRRT